eukprot:CAMPEP_0172821464 /NCGR_PEP_ID=MMETSP1075-20121228/15970_1 /TAXON_ID=2916 /ORGANISM="Ceratium fusus, Strain PA161109" /LENGTH=133 /DNA_ID=CAMNT_0013662297 /DNA_START=511 /DNA_END=910 /DNA_ORIENTATION=-
MKLKLCIFVSAGGRAEFGACPLLAVAFACSIAAAVLLRALPPRGDASEPQPLAAAVAFAPPPPAGIASSAHLGASDLPGAAAPLGAVGPPAAADPPPVSVVLVTSVPQPVFAAALPTAAAAALPPPVAAAAAA